MHSGGKCSGTLIFFFRKITNYLKVLYLWVKNIDWSNMFLYFSHVPEIKADRGDFCVCFVIVVVVIFIVNRQNYLTWTQTQLKEFQNAVKICSVKSDLSSSCWWKSCSFTELKRKHSGGLMHGRLWFCGKIHCRNKIKGLLLLSQCPASIYPTT